MSETIIVWSSIASAVGTIVIALYAIISYNLTKSINTLNASMNKITKQQKDDLITLQTNLIAAIILTSNKNLQGNNLEVLVNDIKAFELF